MVPLFALLVKIGVLPADFFGGLDVDLDAVASDGTVAMKYEDFYGLRTVYSNDDKARASIIEDYNYIIDQSLAGLPSGDMTVNEKAFVKLTVDVSLEDEEDKDFDFSIFAVSEEDELTDAENKLKQADEDRYKIIKAIAREMYKVDNSDYPEDSDTLVEIVDGIKYFGITDEIKNLLETTEDERLSIIDYIAKHYSFETVTIGEETKNFEDLNGEGQLTELATELFGSIIADNISGLSTDRAEKLFIEDFIVNDENKMGAVDKEDYQCVMFMAKKTITYDHIYMYVVNPEESFNSTLEYNSTSVTLTRDDSDIRIDDRPNSTNDTKILFMKTDDKMALTASEFQAIDTTNDECVNYLESGKSLIQIVRDNKTDKYLKAGTDDKYTFIEDGLVWTPVNETDGTRIPFKFIVQEVALAG